MGEDFLLMSIMKATLRSSSAALESLGIAAPALCGPGGVVKLIAVTASSDDQAERGKSGNARWRRHPKIGCKPTELCLAVATPCHLQHRNSDGCAL